MQIKDNGKPPRELRPGRPKVRKSGRKSPEKPGKVCPKTGTKPQKFKPALFPEAEGRRKYYLGLSFIPFVLAVLLFAVRSELRRENERGLPLSASVQRGPRLMCLNNKFPEQ